MGSKTHQIRRFKKELETYQTDSAKASLTLSDIKELATGIPTLSDTEADDSESAELLIDCILKYIEIVWFYSSNLSIKKQIIHTNKFLDPVQNALVEKNMKNVFVQHATKAVFDMILEENINVWCKREILKTYNICVNGSDKTIRYNIASELSYYLYRLTDIISTYGDYDIQATLIETIFRIYGIHITDKNLPYELIPGSTELTNAFMNVNVDRFDTDIRKVLNMLNTNSEMIFSIACSKVIFGDISCIPPVDFLEEINGLWVDFNIKDNAISLYCDIKTFLKDEEQITWNLVTLLGSNVESVKVNRPSSDTHTIIEIQYKEPCLSNLEEAQLVVNKLKKNLKLYTSNTQKDVINKLISKVLPDMFKKQFVHTSTRISNTIKKSYKPLSIKVSTVSARRSFNSSITESVSKSKSDPSFSVEEENIPKISLSNRAVVNLNVSSVTTWSLCGQKNKISSEHEVISISNSDSDIQLLENADFETAPLIESQKNSIQDKVQEPMVTSSQNFVSNMSDSSINNDIEQLKILSGRCTGNSVDYQELAKKGRSEQMIVTQPEVFVTAGDDLSSQSTKNIISQQSHKTSKVSKSILDKRHECPQSGSEPIFHTAEEDTIEDIGHVPLSSKISCRNTLETGPKDLNLNNVATNKPKPSEKKFLGQKIDSNEKKKIPKHTEKDIQSDEGKQKISTKEKSLLKKDFKENAIQGEAKENFHTAQDLSREELTKEMGKKIDSNKKKKIPKHTEKDIQSAEEKQKISTKEKSLLKEDFKENVIQDEVEENVHTAQDLSQEKLAKEIKIQKISQPFQDNQLAETNYNLEKKQLTNQKNKKKITKETPEICSKHNLSEDPYEENYQNPKETNKSLHQDKMPKQTKSQFKEREETIPHIHSEDTINSIKITKKVKSSKIIKSNKTTGSKQNSPGHELNKNVAQGKETEKLSKNNKTLPDEAETTSSKELNLTEGDQDNQPKTDKEKVIQKTIIPKTQKTKIYSEPNSPGLESNKNDAVQRKEKEGLSKNKKTLPDQVKTASSKGINSLEGNQDIQPKTTDKEKVIQETIIPKTQKTKIESEPNSPGHGLNKNDVVQRKETEELSKNKKTLPDQVKTASSKGMHSVESDQDIQLKTTNKEKVIQETIIPKTQKTKIESEPNSPGHELNKYVVQRQETEELSKNNKTLPDQVKTISSKGLNSIEGDQDIQPKTTDKEKVIQETIIEENYSLDDKLSLVKEKTKINVLSVEILSENPPKMSEVNFDNLYITEENYSSDDGQPLAVLKLKTNRRRLSEDILSNEPVKTVEEVSSTDREKDIAVKTTCTEKVQKKSKLLIINIHKLKDDKIFGKTNKQKKQSNNAGIEEHTEKTEETINLKHKQIEQEENNVDEQQTRENETKKFNVTLEQKIHETEENKAVELQKKSSRAVKKQAKKTNYKNLNQIDVCSNVDQNRKEIFEMAVSEDHCNSEVIVLNKDTLINEEMPNSLDQQKLEDGEDIRDLGNVMEKIDILKENEPDLQLVGLKYNMETRKQNTKTFGIKIREDKDKKKSADKKQKRKQFKLDLIDICPRENENKKHTLELSEEQSISNKKNKEQVQNRVDLLKAVDSSESLKAPVLGISDNIKEQDAIDNSQAERKTRNLSKMDIKANKNHTPKDTDVVLNKNSKPVKTPSNKKKAEKTKTRQDKRAKMAAETKTKNIKKTKKKRFRFDDSDSEETKEPGKNDQKSLESPIQPEDHLNGNDLGETQENHPTETQISKEKVLPKESQISSHKEQHKMAEINEESSVSDYYKEYADSINSVDIWNKQEDQNNLLNTKNSTKTLLDQQFDELAETTLTREPVPEIHKNKKPKLTTINKNVETDTLNKPGQMKDTVSQEMAYIHRENRVQTVSQGKQRSLISNKTHLNETNTSFRKRKLYNDDHVDTIQFLENQKMNQISIQPKESLNKECKTDTVKSKNKSKSKKANKRDSKPKKNNTLTKKRKTIADIKTRAKEGKSEPNNTTHNRDRKSITNKFDDINAHSSFDTSIDWNELLKDFRRLNGDESTMKQKTEKRNRKTKQREKNNLTNRFNNSSTYSFKNVFDLNKLYRNDSHVKQIQNKNFKINHNSFKLKKSNKTFDYVPRFDLDAQSDVSDSPKLYKKKDIERTPPPMLSSEECSPLPELFIVRDRKKSPEYFSLTPVKNDKAENKKSPEYHKQPTESPKINIISNITILPSKRKLDEMDSSNKRVKLAAHHEVEEVDLPGLETSKQNEAQFGPEHSQKANIESSSCVQCSNDIRVLLKCFGKVLSNEVKCHDKDCSSDEIRCAGEICTALKSYNF